MYLFDVVYVSECVLTVSNIVYMYNATVIVHSACSFWLK